MLSLLAGCAQTSNHHVLATTATVIGVEIAQAPTGNSPQAKLGYNRAEFAYVPTTLTTKYDGSGKKTEDGIDASKSAEVIMELRYGNIFSLSTGGIYQRLAVGSEAVKQAGAALMFAKDKDGNIDADTAAAVKSAVTASDTPTVNLLALRHPLNLAFLDLQGDAALKALFDHAAKTEFADYAAFSGGNPTEAKIKQVRTELEKNDTIKAAIAKHTP